MFHNHEMAVDVWFQIRFPAQNVALINIKKEDCQIWTEVSSNIQEPCYWVGHHPEGTSVSKGTNHDPIITTLPVKMILDRIHDMEGTGRCLGHLFSGIHTGRS